MEIDVMRITRRQLRRIIKEELNRTRRRRSGRRRSGRRRLREATWGARPISSRDAWDRFPDAMAMLEDNTPEWFIGEDWRNYAEPGDEEFYSKENILQKQSEYYIGPNGELVHFWADPKGTQHRDTWLMWTGADWDEPDDMTMDAIRGR